MTPRGFAPSVYKSCKGSCENLTTWIAKKNCNYHQHRTIIINRAEKPPCDYSIKITKSLLFPEKESFNSAQSRNIVNFLHCCWHKPNPNSNTIGNFVSRAVFFHGKFGRFGQTLVPCRDSLKNCRLISFLGHICSQKDLFNALLL